MPTLDESFPLMLAALSARYGQPPTVLGRDAFEALVAVVLARALEPRKLDTALKGLADAGLLDPRALAEAEATEIVDALRAGGVRLTAKALGPLRRLARWLVDDHEGSTEWLQQNATPTDQIREELIGLNGIGPATADTILLYAWQRPAYPVDRATYRILVRHGWLEPSADYDEARNSVQRLSPDDPGALASLSDWLVRIGREFCRVSAPKCDRCPLNLFLPEGGPLEPGGLA